MLHRLRANTYWRAMITPLASIIGSGFLILGPVLAQDYGAWAPVAMIALCAVAWGFGMSIRANITRIGDGPAPTSLAERISGVLLALAYVISVSYYLNLFGAFAVSLTPVAGPTGARIVTTVAYVLILILGWTKGFDALERLEYPTVALKLAVIAALLVALAVNFAGTAADHALILPAAQTQGWHAIVLGFGLLVTVQGFETSRYLGATYDAGVRVTSMKMAQGLATVIYVIYVVFLVFAVPITADAVSETEIITLMRTIAPVLPMMLVAAALAAQFSAALADTGGAGGLLVELTGRRYSARQGYLALVAIGLALTWAADVFQIIAYASRAFAAYYGVQSLIAARHAKGPARVLHGALTLLAVAIALLGVPIEG
ncbi:MAG: hypothetical protein WD046_11800 [Paracoccaceae bacterium]